MAQKSVARSKRLGILLSMLTIPFLLSGCFKFTMDLEVSNRDRISGTAVVALSKELQALAQAGSGGPTDAFANLDGVKVIEFDDGTFFGQQYQFSGLPIEQFALNDDASALRIQREGDNLFVSGELSFEDETAGAAGGDDFGFGQVLFESADLRVSIKFPGEIVSTNGRVNEATNTITWEPKYGEANELRAVVYAPRGFLVWELLVWSNRFVFEPILGPLWEWGMWFNFAVSLGVLLLGVPFMVIRQRREKTVNRLEPAAEKSAEQIAHVSK